MRSIALPLPYHSPLLYLFCTHIWGYIHCVARVRLSSANTFPTSPFCSRLPYFRRRAPLSNHVAKLLPFASSDNTAFC